MAVSPQDIHDLAIGLFAEARGESRKGKAGVGHVIATRAALTGLSIGDVLKQGRQFSFNFDRNLARAKYAAERNTRGYQEAVEIAHGVLNDTVPNPKPGATHFQVSSTPPDPKFDRLGKAGRHSFFGGKVAEAHVRNYDRTFAPVDYGPPTALAKVAAGVLAPQPRPARAQLATRTAPAVDLASRSRFSAVPVSAFGELATAPTPQSRPATVAAGKSIITTGIAAVPNLADRTLTGLRESMFQPFDSRRAAQMEKLDPRAVSFMGRMEKDLQGVVPSISVISAHRSPSHPVEKAKAKPGMHSKGIAIDIRTSGMSKGQQAAVVEAALRNGARGIGFYGSLSHPSSMHFDLRDKAVVWGPSKSRISLDKTPEHLQPVLSSYFDPAKAKRGVWSPTQPVAPPENPRARPAQQPVAPPVDLATRSRMPAGIEVGARPQATPVASPLAPTVAATSPAMEAVNTLATAPPSAPMPQARPDPTRALIGRESAPTPRARPTEPAPVPQARPDPTRALIGRDVAPTPRGRPGPAAPQASLDLAAEIAARATPADKAVRSPVTGPSPAEFALQGTQEPETVTTSTYEPDLADQRIGQAFQDAGIEPASSQQAEAVKAAAGFPSTTHAQAVGRHSIGPTMGPTSMPSPEALALAARATPARAAPAKAPTVTATTAVPLDVREMARARPNVAAPAQQIGRPDPTVAVAPPDPAQPVPQARPDARQAPAIANTVLGPKAQDRLPSGKKGFGKKDAARALTGLVIGGPIGAIVAPAAGRVLGGVRNAMAPRSIIASPRPGVTTAQKAAPGGLFGGFGGGGHGFHAVGAGMSARDAAIASGAGRSTANQSAWDAFNANMPGTGWAAETAIAQMSHEMGKANFGSTGQNDALGLSQDQTGTSGAGTGGGTILCSYFHRLGWVPRNVWRGTTLWSLRNVDERTRQAYYWWAEPLIEAMEHHPWLRWPVFYGVVRPWAFEAAFRAGHHDRSSLFRRAHMALFLAANRALGAALFPNRRPADGHPLLAGRAVARD